MALRANTTKKTGFVYKPRSQESVKERANRSGGDFDSIYKSGITKTKNKVGDNCRRILPPTWEDADHYAYKIYVHYGVGANNSQYLCPKKMLGKPCAICDEVKELTKSGEKDEAKKLDVKERYVCWNLDRDGDHPEKPEIWELSWTMDRDIAAQCVHPRTGEILFIDEPDTGYDLMFKRKGTGPTNTEYYGYQIDRASSPVHEKERVQDEILDYIAENPIPNVLNYYDNEHLKKVLSGSVAEKDAEADEDEDPPFEGGRRTGGKSETRTENSRRSPKEDHPEDGEEDADAPVGRTVRSSRRQEVQKDEEVNEEDDTPPPSRTRSGGRTRVVQEEPEDDQGEEDVSPRRAVGRGRR
jgi:hypothetical protein